MEKKTINFSYRTRGGFSPTGLQKVFFSYHPDDTEPMNWIVKDVLSIMDCAVYYHSAPVSLSDIDISDFELKLQEMKLFVVIVTTNYLQKDSLAKNWEYGFAIKNHIPILPIAMETGLESYFSIEMNHICSGYGDIQLLRYQVTDSTEISYRRKLVRDLNSILVSGTDMERIKKAFHGQIFLSYRKKDRKYANELMRTIHDIPSLQNTSIWYDEFISSGEAWSDQIWDALRSSNVFLLMVTPSITEPDNYVIREEYPAARRLDMKIVPARKAADQYNMTDIKKLEKLFPDVKSLIDGDDAAALEQALIELAMDKETTPENDYLVGLAFFNGIHVEKNSEKAVALIIAAAQKGLPEAINKLSEMYWNGDGIPLNYDYSIQWRKRLISLYEKDFQKTKNSLEEALCYVKAIEKLCINLFELSSYRDSLTYGRKLIEVASIFSSSWELPEFHRYRLSAYDLLGKICSRLGMYDKAADYFEQYCIGLSSLYDSDKSMINRHNLSVSYERMGDVKYAVRDFIQAEYWYMKALKIRMEIDGEMGSIDSAFSLSCIYLVLGDIHIRKSEPCEADQMYARAVALRKRILYAEDTPFHRKGYGEAILGNGTLKLLSDDVENAKVLLDEALEVFANLADEYGTIEAQREYSIALNRCGKVASAKGDHHKALRNYQESVNRRKKILSHVRVNDFVFDCALSLVLMADSYKQLCENFQAKQSYDEAIEMLLPILPKDKKCDWHYTFAEASFERFKLDTFSGKKYLEYAIDSWKWLMEKLPDNTQYRKKYEVCKKMYQRCYPK